MLLVAELCTRKPADVNCVTSTWTFLDRRGSPNPEAEELSLSMVSRTAPLNLVVHVPRRINIEANLQKLSLVAYAGFVVIARSLSLHPLPLLPEVHSSV